MGISSESVAMFYFLVLVSVLNSNLAYMYNWRTNFIAYRGHISENNKQTKQ